MHIYVYYSGLRRCRPDLARLRLCTLVTNMKWLRLQKFQNIWLRLHNPVYNVIEIICIQYIYFIYNETIIIVLVDMWEKIGDCNDCRGDMEIYSYQVSTRISLRSMYTYRSWIKQFFSLSFSLCQTSVNGSVMKWTRLSVDRSVINLLEIYAGAYRET